MAKVHTDLRLKVIEGPAAGEERTFPGDGAVTIGRSEKADLTIDDTKISRLHCRLEPGEGNWVLSDLSSRNGTWVGGQKVRSKVVRHGNEFVVGKDTRILIALVPGKAPAPAPVPAPTQGSSRGDASHGTTSPAPSSPEIPVLAGPFASLPGTNLGEFRVVEPAAPLGPGPFFRCMQPSLNRHVMLEVFTADEMNSPGVRDDLVREVRQAARLIHPGVIQIFDMGESRGFTYVSMELFQGKTLARILNDRGFVPIGSALAIGRQLCDAFGGGLDGGVPVGRAHPGDIWIDTQFTAKVKFFREPGSPTPPVSHYAYQAPEVLAGAEGTDPRAAVYTVGALLYHMLAAASPIPGESRDEIARRARHDTPPPLRRANIKVTAMLARVVEQALAKEPSARQPDLRTLDRELRRTTTPTL
jgi:hypothetical protein